MPTIRARAWVPAPIEEVFAFFDDPANLARLMPPPVRISLARVDPAPAEAGSVLEFRYGLGPIQRSWVVQILERVPNERFVDTTLRGPLARFDHTHGFRATPRGTWIEDRVDYHVGPDGLVGSALDGLAGWAMRATFVWRHARQRRIFRSARGTARAGT